MADNNPLVYYIDIFFIVIILVTSENLRKRNFWLHHGEMCMIIRLPRAMMAKNLLVAA